MDLKIYKQLTLLLLVSFGFMGQSHAQSTPIFDQLKARFNAGEVYKGKFDHTYQDSYTEEITRTDGTIWINAVGYKLESNQQKIVVDGEISQVYDGSRNRVIISEYEAEEDDFAPSRMLSGIDDTYTATEEQIGNGRTKITLITTDDFAAFITVEIEVSAQLLPLTITAYDIADNVITTTFSDGAFIENDSSIFEFTHPEDAEIVDMRY
ncbi:MAG: outer membrane lipoprotein carrier protein LolA [Balneolaceae bacterium]|nr:outer membrane lipoprotein carrier protein LolA [Balneolaceae bacterium]